MVRPADGQRQQARDGREAHGEHPPPLGPVELARRVEQAARRGYAVAEEELEPGLVAVAAPVRRFDGSIVSALNVSGPAFRFGARLDEAGAEVARAAERLSLILNGQDAAVSGT